MRSELVWQKGIVYGELLVARGGAAELLETVDDPLRYRNIARRSRPSRQPRDGSYKAHDPYHTARDAKLLPYGIAALRRAPYPQ
jgi:hypothetical protein